MVTPSDEAPVHLRGIVAKIQRAEEHLITLDKEILAYLEDCRDTATHPIYIDPQQNTIRLYFEPIAEPSVRISIIVGDLVHNLRTTIDHVWKRLGKDGNFPLFGDREGPTNWNTKKADRLSGLSVEVQAVIDALQPCHYGKEAPLHPLSVLNHLSNIDKHEAIHLTTPMTIDSEFTFFDKGSTVPAFVLRPSVILHDHAEVVITDVPHGVCKPDMDVNIKGTLFVAFKTKGPVALKPVQEVLGGCLNFIKKCVALLGPHTR